MAISSISAGSSYPAQYPSMKKGDAAATADTTQDAAASAPAKAVAPAKTATAGADGKPAEQPSAIVSLASGALGLENPSEVKPAEEENSFYSAGRFLAAVGTVGTIISLLA